MIELLRGVRVLECAVLPSGDNAGRILGDLGAEVTKIEQPGTGDYIRVLGDQLAPENSSIHLLINRNKRSLTLNLRTDEGRRIFYRLLPNIDIFVDGFAGDACARLGVGYEDQCKVKPDIIYAQASGFGKAGPYGQMPVHGYQMGALAGATRFRPRGDGLYQEVLDLDNRYFPGYPDGPLMGGIFGALTAVSALNYRNATGKGVYIDSSGADATLLLQGADVITAWNQERITFDANRPPVVGTDTRDRPKYACYVTKDDRFIQFGAIEHKFWDNFCKAAGRPDLAGIKYLQSPIDFRNVGGRKDLADEIQAIFATHTLAEWMDIARQCDIPMSPANSVGEARQDPHFTAREIVHQSVHPIAGPFVAPGWPAPVSGQPFDVGRHAPALGEHTDEILATLEFSAEEIAALRKRGVV